MSVSFMVSALFTGSVFGRCHTGSGMKNGGLKTGLKKAYLWSKMSSIQMVRKVIVTLPFEYQTPMMSSIQMNPILRCLVFRWLLYATK